MKKILIAAGALAAVAGLVYSLKDNEELKQMLDKLNASANDRLARLSPSWKAANEKFNEQWGGRGYATPS